MLIIWYINKNTTGR